VADNYNSVQFGEGRQVLSNDATSITKAVATGGQATSNAPGVRVNTSSFARADIGPNGEVNAFQGTATAHVNMAEIDLGISGVLGTARRDGAPVAASETTSG
jgi:hypothetical protein